MVLVFHGFDDPRSRDTLEEAIERFAFLALNRFHSRVNHSTYRIATVAPDSYRSHSFTPRAYFKIIKSMTMMDMPLIAPVKNSNLFITAPPDIQRLSYRFGF